MALKGYNNSEAKLPAEIRINVDGKIDLITYPVSGTLREKKDYVLLVNALRITCLDESIIT